jgi:hypothetical protein
MGYVYREVDGLQNHELVGSGECVDLVKKLTPGLKGIATIGWRQGESVVEYRGILRAGTAIATFDRDGRFNGTRAHGQHAAFFVRSSAAGIWVMDQWRNDPRKPRVSMRFVRRLGKHKDGSFVDPSNNADAFSVIER